MLWCVSAAFGQQYVLVAPLAYADIIPRPTHRVSWCPVNTYFSYQGSQAGCPHGFLFILFLFGYLLDPACHSPSLVVKLAAASGELESRSRGLCPFRTLQLSHVYNSDTGITFLMSFCLEQTKRGQCRHR